MKEKVSNGAFDWTKKKIKFKDTKIEDVIKKIETLYGVQLDVEQEGMKHCKITYAFRKSSIDETLDAIVSTFNNWSYKKIGDKYILSGESCKE